MPNASLSPVRRLAALATLLFLSQVGHAQTHGGGATGTVERHVDIVYYEVHGETIGEIARSLRSRGPLSDGQRFFGKTDWLINAEYEWTSSDTGCRIENVTIRLLVTITLPRWEPPARAPSSLVGAWNRFARALSNHEHNHRRLADEAAEAIRWDLSTLRFGDCRHSEERARQRVMDIIEEYGRRNRRYDERTQHGYTEGAVWPPN